MKIYNKVDNEAKKQTPMENTKKRDVSPINFKHRSNPHRDS